MSRFYHIDPTPLSAADLAEADTLMSVVWAEEELRTNASEYDADDLYKLIVMATGDTEEADTARAQAILKEMEAADMKR